MEIRHRSYFENNIKEVSLGLEFNFFDFNLQDVFMAWSAGCILQGEYLKFISKEFNINKDLNYKEMFIQMMDKNNELQQTINDMIPKIGNTTNTQNNNFNLQRPRKRLSLIQLTN